MAETLKICEKSDYNNDEGREMFRSAISMLQGGKIPTLIVTDQNTKGCSHFPATGGKVSPWESLVNSEGHSEKQENTALGSFGLGKHAPFAVTPLRCVLYSTRYKTSGGGEDTRFIGRSILVSHKRNGTDEYLSADGYLGGGSEGFEALSGEDIPPLWRLSAPGTLVAIPGYTGEVDENGSSWDDLAFNAVMDSFFYAILFEKLEILIDGEAINRQSVLEESYKYRIDKEKTVGYLEVAQRPAVETYIAGIGDVKLHIKTGGQDRRALALVRHPGLMITDIAKNMDEANPSIPTHWLPFTAVVCVTPQETDKDRFLIEAEAPSHDRLSVQQVPEQHRRAARKALRELRDWLYKEIAKVADTSVSTEQIGADELDRFGLVLEDRTPAGINTVRVTPPKCLQKAPRLRKNPEQLSLNVETPDSDVETPDSDGETSGTVSDHKNEGKGGGVSGDTTETPTTIERLPRLESKPMFRPVISNGIRDTHKLVLSMETLALREEKSDMKVEMLYLGEDESAYRIGIMSAQCGAVNLATDRNVFILKRSLLASEERLDVEMRLNEPIGSRTFDIVCHKE